MFSISSSMHRLARHTTNFVKRIIGKERRKVKNCFSLIPLPSSSPLVHFETKQSIIDVLLCYLPNVCLSRQASNQHQVEFNGRAQKRERCLAVCDSRRVKALFVLKSIFAPTFRGFNNIQMCLHLESFLSDSQWNTLSLALSLSLISDCLHCVRKENFLHYHIDSYCGFLFSFRFIKH